ncbi:MAG: holo-ACP synthase [bacterium]
MVAGIGIDIVEVERIHRMLIKWEERFTHRLFTPCEIQQCSERANQAQCFAARFAAKEALAKALGHGWCKHFIWTDVEVFNENSGKPAFVVQGVTKKLVEKRKVKLSLTHTKEYAAAVVLVEKL